jgi:hypothetical protein
MQSVVHDQILIYIDSASPNSRTFATQRSAFRPSTSLATKLASHVRASTLVSRLRETMSRPICTFPTCQSLSPKLSVPISSRLKDSIPLTLDSNSLQSLSPTRSCQARFFATAWATAVALALHGKSIRAVSWSSCTNLIHHHSFETREICEEVIKRYHGQAIGDECFLMQVRYADTPSQKELKRVTAERRQYRTNEYNIGAYGTIAVGINPSIYSQQPSSWGRTPRFFGLVMPSRTTCPVPMLQMLTHV